MRLEPSFIGDLLQSAALRGRNLLGRSPSLDPRRLPELVELLLSRRGEVSGIALARLLLDSYAASDREDRHAFLRLLAQGWGGDAERVERLLARHAGAWTTAALAELHAASEPRRQELLRRLNTAPGGTAALLAMRTDLIEIRNETPDLAALDRDFVHLFSSWFNRGFLQLRSIEWTTQANILEKIIRYEAVHALRDWTDLRDRLEPEDRRCFAFFHPALPDEPLIFVEVALGTELSDRIDVLLAPERSPKGAAEATTAIFYSISNCQPGLAGVSFGSLLIKQVAEDLKHELPRLRTFATLSPLPGLAGWLGAEIANEDSDWLSPEMREALAVLDRPDWPQDETAREQVRAPLMAATAQYLLRARDTAGRPRDPVARFHLGNGARLERMNLLADPSATGMARSHGMMVNYLYALDEIERNHEAFAQAGTVAASGAVRSRLPHVPSSHR